MLQRLAFLLLLVPAKAWAQEPVVLTQMESPILDGIIDPLEWGVVQPFPMTQYQPVFGGTPSERTEIRVGYDQNFLYVGAAMYDSEPSGIRANTLYRDKYSGDDTFGLVLDTFDDNENGLWFFTTPNGVRVDMAIAGDGEGGIGGRGGFGSMNSSWNTYWDVATSVGPDGWFAEMRIPYSSLGFIDDDGEVQMGLITYRYIARKNERHIFPAIDPAFRMGFAKPSQAQAVILRGVESRKPVYITPYATAGAGGASVLNAPGTAYDWDGEVTREVGLDVKQSLGSNLTLDLTVNTDFAQVEADDQQVNLTRFSLFFPEKRQFFQERAGIFEFSTGNRDRLFHTRSIGLSSYGPVRILGGGRLVGRVGGWDIGLLDMQTARSTFDVEGDAVTVPTENFGVLRLRRRVVNDYSYAGGIVTSRLGEDGEYNVTYGVDGTVRWRGDDYATLQFAQTFDDDTPFGFADAALARLWLERRTQEGFLYRGGFTYGGDTYDPGVGFNTRRNYYSPRGGIGYGWFPGDDSPVRRVTLESLVRLYYRRSDHSLESGVYSVRNSIEMRTGHNISIDVQNLVEDLPSALSFPESTTVPAGRYRFTEATANIRLPNGGFLRGNGSAGYGTFYDGTRFQAGVSPSFSPSRHLELETSYEYNQVDFDDRGQSFHVHLARLRAQLGFNTRISLNGFVQVNSSADVLTTNARFRYNFREGNDLWIVYNEGLNLDRARAFPLLPVSSGRTLLLKYTYTFIQ